MTQAMTAAVRASYSLLGHVATRDLYSDLLKCPHLEEGLFQEVLKHELQLTGHERLPAAKLQAIFEVSLWSCCLKHFSVHTFWLCT